MAMESREYVRRIAIAVAIVGTILVLSLLFWYVSQVFLVVFAGVLGAVFLDGLARQLAVRSRLPRRAALAAVVLALAGALGAFAALAGPPISDQAGQLGERVPEAFQRIEDRLEHTSWGRALLRSTPAPDEMVPPASAWLGRVSGVFSTALGAVTNAVLIVLIAFYVAWNPGLYVDGALRLLPPGRRARGREVAGALGHALRWWLIGRAAAMAVVGVLTAVGLAVIGLPLVLALGLIAGLLSFVPYIGPVLSAVPAVLIGLLESPLQAVNVVIVFSAVQFVEGNFLTPVIQRRVVSLPPAVLLTAQLLMGVLFGLMGVLLATPLAVAAIVSVQMLYVEDVLGDDVRLLGEHGPRPEEDAEARGGEPYAAG